MFSVNTKSSGLNLCFRDGLVWTVDLIVEIKLCFQINFNFSGVLRTGSQFSFMS